MKWLLIAIIILIPLTTAEVCNPYQDVLNGSVPYSAVYKDCNFNYTQHQEDIDRLNNNTTELRNENYINWLILWFLGISALIIIFLVIVNHYKNNQTEV